MDKTFLNTIALLFISLIGFAQGNGNKLVVEGQYHSKNLYVNNPMSESGVGFCVNEVRVNGEITTDEWNSSAFEIDLKQKGLKSGAEILVEIEHKDGCKPKILNPNVLKPRATFKVEQIDISSKGLLKWRTSNEKGKLPFKIQQFKWNKWVTVGEIQGKGTPGKHSYSFETIPVAGDNRFRVKQEGMDGGSKTSASVELVSDKEKIEYEQNKKEEDIEFSRETSFELYNKYGELVKKGFGDKLDLSNFERKTYYLNFGSRTVEFKKR